MKTWLIDTPLVGDARASLDGFKIRNPTVLACGPNGATLCSSADRRRRRPPPAALSFFTTCCQKMPMPRDRHAVAHYSYEKRADDDTYHFSDLARGRDATDETRSDHVEFEGIAGAWRRRIEARGDNQAGKSGKDTMLTKVSKVSRSVRTPESCAASRFPPIA